MSCAVVLIVTGEVGGMACDTFASRGLACGAANKDSCCAVVTAQTTLRRMDLSSSHKGGSVCNMAADAVGGNRGAGCVNLHRGAVVMGVVGEVWTMTGLAIATIGRH